MTHLSSESMFSELFLYLQEGVQQLVLGLYIIRGDNMYASHPILLSCVLYRGRFHFYSWYIYIYIFLIFNICSSVVGELDEELDANLDLSKLRAHPLKPVIHWSTMKYNNVLAFCMHNRSIFGIANKSIARNSLSR